MKTEILIGSALEKLRQLPEKSVHMCVTSPPYWGLRSYNLRQWTGGDPDCKHEGKPSGRGENVESSWDRPSRIAVPRETQCKYCDAVQVDVEGGIGLEETWEEHLDNLLAVFGEVRRVLRDDGILVVNYGDAYAGSGKGHMNDVNPGLSRSFERGCPPTRKTTPKGTLNLPPKSLMMMPARLAIAMQEDGWILRSEVVWAKKNSMPESVTDRPTSAHEKVFVFAKRPKYYWDQFAVRTRAKETSLERYQHALNHDPHVPPGRTSHSGIQNTGRKRYPTKEVNGMRDRNAGMDGTANMRNVLHLPTSPYKEAHFATYPPALVEPFIKAGTSAHGVCDQCGAPYERIVETSGGTKGKGGWHNHEDDLGRGQRGARPTHDWSIESRGWKQSCECSGAKPVPAKVLDCFGGSGTTGMVANRLGRDAILVEISEEYALMASARIETDRHGDPTNYQQGLFD